MMADMQLRVTPQELKKLTLVPSANWPSTITQPGPNRGGGCPPIFPVSDEREKSARSSTTIALFGIKLFYERTFAAKVWTSGGSTVFGPACSLDMHGCRDRPIRGFKFWI
jgi:hypothetical protein